jgi:hypothetical protein
LLPRLEQRHQQVAARQRAAQWNAAADAVEQKRNAVADEFATAYPALFAQLIDLFQLVHAVDAEVDTINAASPNSESRRISPSVRSTSLPPANC